MSLHDRDVNVNDRDVDESNSANLASHTWYFNYSELKPLILPLIIGRDEESEWSDSEEDTWSEVEEESQHGHGSQGSSANDTDGDMDDNSWNSVSKKSCEEHECSSKQNNNDNKSKDMINRPCKARESSNDATSSSQTQIIKLNRDENSEAYLRVIMHNLDVCSAKALQRSGGKIGKCNVILDSSGFGLSMIPPMSVAKRFIIMMQDHFPDRLGVLVIANLGCAAQVLLKLIMPLVPEAVRYKIHVLPNDRKSQIDMLGHLVNHAYIPDWLGGNDTFRFDANIYYSTDMTFGTDAEGTAYLETMPYHA